MYEDLAASRKKKQKQKQKKNPEKMRASLC